MKRLPNIGDCLVVQGMSKMNSTVESIRWDPQSVDWLIVVDWGSYGKSRIWARDEGSIWKKWIDLN